MTLPAELYPALALGTGLAGALGVGLGALPPARAATAARGLLLLAVASSLALLAVRPAEPGALLRLDGPAVLWQVLFLVAAVPLALLMPMASELPAALAAAALLGMALLAAANHLVLLFIGLEIMSLPSYLLVSLLAANGDARERRVSLEAAIKYFFAGSAGSALFLFGASVFYGLTGTLSMDPLAIDSPQLELALAFMGAGALFKLGAVPLHFWLPDVYEASAPELVGFFSTAVKAAGLLFLLRVLALLPPATAGLAKALPYLAVATMTLGNLLALRQRSLQRLLAYSSIAHVGYLLLGVWAWSASRRLGGPLPAPASVYVYAAAYLFMSTGAFVALRLGGLRTRAQLVGFAARRPALGAFLALMLLSLASIPPTGGFLAKFFIFWDALKAGGGWLAGIAAANSVLGLGYYFALIRDLYLGTAGPETAPDPGPLPPRARLIVLGCAAPTLILGLWPGAWRLATELLSR